MHEAVTNVNVCINVVTCLTFSSLLLLEWHQIRLSWQPCKAIQLLEHNKGLISGPEEVGAATQWEDYKVKKQLKKIIVNREIIDTAWNC